jgi:hypothetical protein
MRTIVLLALLAFAGIAGCRGAGPYSYAPKYVASSEEEAAASGAREFDPVMYQREPETWRKSPTTLFGVVRSRAPGPGGNAYLTVSIRRLEPRNLCTNANDEDTCRVTVTDREFGTMHMLVKLRPEDDVGEKSAGVGSLVRVVGQIGEDVDPNDGAPIIRGTFYRHWPRYYYVTSARSDLMKQ